jgi:cobalt-zinc-cadmium efflux system protein
MSAHHAHHTHHAHSAGQPPPPFLLALGITLLYALVELIGGIWSGSLALKSDAGHMFSDALALGLAAGAAWLAQRPPGVRHSYGLARAEVLGATLNGLIMLGVIGFIVVEAVDRLLEPRPVLGGAVMAIAGAGLLVNAFVAYILSRSHSTLNVRAALIHVIGDLLSSVAALTAGAVIFVTGWVLIDPILSVLIAALILVTTLRLLRDALHVLMEGVPAAFDLAEIGSALAALRGVTAVHDLHVWSIGAEHPALSAHLEIDRLADWPSILESARRLLRERFGVEHVTLQPELAHRTRLPRKATVRIWRRGERPAR